MSNSNQNIEQQIIAKSMKDKVYKQQLLSNPKAIFEQELGRSLPEDVEIEVLETTKNKAYLVLPLKVDQLQSQELSEQELEVVAGGTLITTLPMSPLCTSVPCTIT